MCTPYPPAVPVFDTPPLPLTYHIPTTVHRYEYTPPTSSTPTLRHITKHAFDPPSLYTICPHPPPTGSFSAAARAWKQRVRPLYPRAHRCEIPAVQCGDYYWVQRGSQGVCGTCVKRASDMFSGEGMEATLIEIVLALLNINDTYSSSADFLFVWGLPSSPSPINQPTPPPIPPPPPPSTAAPE